MNRVTPISEYLSLFFIVISLYLNFVSIASGLDGLQGFDDIVIVLALFWQFAAFLLSYPFFRKAWKNPLLSVYRGLIRNGYLINGLSVILIIIFLQPNYIGYIVFGFISLIELYPVWKISKRKY